MQTDKDNNEVSAEELEKFRENWQRVLKLNHGESHNSIENLKKVEASEIHLNDEIQQDHQIKAEILFQKAVELEKCGKVYDALPFYKKAVQILPDIERIFYERQKIRNVTTIADAIEEKATTTTEPKDLFEFDEDLDLYEKFQLDLAQEQAYSDSLLLSSLGPGVISSECHISKLPPEILLYILRFVISSNLDMKSLENCANVCKGMYLCARDEELWRCACFKIWGVNVGTPQNPGCEQFGDSVEEELPIYQTWRQMFIHRTRVLYNGCYISKTTYLRMGENSFQDQFYRPIQLVEYYRYIRFLPDSTLLMMTTAEEPSTAVSKLRYMQTSRSDVLHGHYRLIGSTLICLLKKIGPVNQRLGGFVSRQKRNNSPLNADEINCTKYHMEFEIASTPKRKFCQLLWRHYSIVQTRNNVETSTNFEITSSKYPPLWFSPVRSYHLVADLPLL